MTASSNPNYHAPTVSVEKERWRPTRAGLLNVWQYTDEVLEFEQGRLVLYGPNGSGKTMALELLLPHLLDAKGLPGSLSTSGAERGGLWERVSGYDEGEPRTGYLWLEFSPDNKRTFTIGVRLRAKPSGGGDKHWFTTPKRIGSDFSLLDQNRRPLSAEQLAEAVGLEGRVWGSDTGGYRQAVRTTLFPGWAEDRLDALIRTLLVVRKQNVTDGLSPGKLSELLSESLPPLDDLELGKIADGFADLDRRRDHIAQIEKDVAETKRLTEANQAYAISVVARVVKQVVAATTEFDNVAREVRRLSDELKTWNAQVGDLEGRQANLEIEDQQLAGQLDGLKSSDAYKHGAEIENLRQAAQNAGRIAKEAATDANAANERARTHRQDADKAQGNHAHTERQLRSARQELDDVAKGLGADMLADVAGESLAPTALTWIEGRCRAIQVVRDKLHALDLAAERRKSAHKHQTSCEEQLSNAEEQLHIATQVAEEARKRWRDRVDYWRADARELATHLETLDDPFAAVALVAEARSNAQGPLLKRRAEIENRITVLDVELKALQAERHAWLTGKDPEPDVPQGRRDRAELAGAPLWKVVQFREHVLDNVRGSIESALADTRLLDAWISPEGQVLIAEGESDLLLTTIANPSDTAENGRTLATVLEPDPAAHDLSYGTVETLLRSLALIERDAHQAPIPLQGVIIGIDGSWRTARLAGRSAPGPARYIGASSREATRQTRIEVLDRDITVREDEKRIHQADLGTLELRIQRCKMEVDSFPPIKEIQDSDQDVNRKRATKDSLEDQLVRANAALTKANEELRGHERALHTAADEHGLPTDTTRIGKVEDRLNGLRTQVFTFQQRHERTLSAKHDASLAERFAAEAARDAELRSTTARIRSGEAMEAASRFAAVEKSLGSGYGDVLNEIGVVTARRSEIQAEQKSLQREHSQSVEKRGSTITAVTQAEVRRSEAEKQRTCAGEIFVALCRDGLLSDASITDPPALAVLATTTAILEEARRIRSSEGFPPPPDEADLARLSNHVMARLGEASRQLAGRADLNFEATDHFWSVLRARREGTVVSSSTLLAGLREDLEAAKSELSQKQQELFEQILSGSIRDHLRGRLWAAQALVDRINSLLEEIRTESGGVRVSLKWEINPDLSDALELRQAKELLLHDSPIARGRSQLDAFLRGRIERVRAAEDDTGEWRDRLARMLDYRSWHRFRVLVHHNRFGDQPRPLDSKKVSLSAGEKTIVMVLPLIAAVTAHYEPAPGEPPCKSPRLLLMDELFPKLDFPNKRKVMGLLPTLHLDAVFTSDKDRCEYDTLDGIAIHVCQKLANDKTTTTRLVWNGFETRALPAQATDAFSGEPDRVGSSDEVEGDSRGR